MTLVNMLEVSASKAGKRPLPVPGAPAFVEQVLGSYEIAQQILRAEKNSGLSG
jgi:hypothetical protein